MTLRYNRLFKTISVLFLIVLMFFTSVFPAQAAVKDGWNKKKTIYYQDGEKYNGELKVDGKWYYFVKGKPQKRFQQVGEPPVTKYYNKKNGARVSGFTKIRGKTYYFKKKTGAMKTGWLVYDGKRYFFDQDGLMVTGTLKKNGLIYWFDKNGTLTKVYTAELRDQIKEDQATRETNTKASALAGLSPNKFIKTVGPLFTADQKRSGVLASVSLAQFILESGYGQSKLTLKANNCFGMKQYLSGNTWQGTYWNGKSVYKIRTGEEASDGSHYYIYANFRKYSCIEDSIADHSAYLCGAMNGSELRYAGIQGCKKYKKAAKLLQKGGYATSSNYAKTLIELIERWNLTKYDLKKGTSA